MHCDECGKEIKVNKKTSCGTGYGTTDDDRKICYECCAKMDKQTMLDDGKYVLYLSKNKEDRWEVTNWPGTLRFKVTISSHGTHNIARTRHDVWFAGPDGHVWWGVQYGEWTQICHCKRTKQVA